MSREVKPPVNSEDFLFCFMARNGSRKLTYSEKLKDPRWQQKRLRIFERDKFRCQLCTDERSTLSVHHDQYKGNPWDISDEHLRTLCSHCHSIIHELPNHTVKEVFKRISINKKCWEVVAFTTTDIIFLYLFFENSAHTDKVEIITVFPNK